MPPDSSTLSGPKLGVIAGKGALPALIVDAARTEARPLFILALEGQTDPALVAGIDHAWIPMGAVGRGIDALKRSGVVEVVFAGGVRRPSLLRLGLDGRATRLLAKVGRAALGDDRILSVLVRELEGEGLRVVGADDVLSDLLATPGPLGARRPDETAEGDIARGIEVGRVLGRLDIGQAVIVQQGYVLGVEAAEGTDPLIARSADLSREGPGGVLVKIKKPGQERRADLPTIGVGTVEACAAAGLRGIAVEAGATLVLGRDAVAAAADRTGLFVTGVQVDDVDDADTPS